MFHAALTLNLSMIPSNEPTVQENMPCPLTQVVPLPSVPPPLAEENEEPIKPPAIVATTLSGNLSTITEESENYRSSQSSSKFTVSSGSSRYSHYTHIPHLHTTLITCQVLYIFFSK